MSLLLNKRILLGLAMIVFAGAVVAGATGAFFSDTETSNGNTFAAGNLDLSVDGGSWTSPEFTITGGLPGDDVETAVLLETTADAWLRVEFNATATDPVDSADVALLGDVNYVIFESTTGSPNTINPLTADSDGAYYPASFLDDATTDYTVGIYACFGTITSGGTVLSDYSCDGSAVGNASQGGSITADFSVEARQYQNNENQTTPW